MSDVLKVVGIHSAVTTTIDTALSLTGDNVERPQEAAETLSDHDSALGSSYTDGSTSISSSLYDGILQNGRIYHKYCEGGYLLPEDETEQDRLNAQHYLWELTLGEGRNYLTILEPGVQSILDMGTGTGIWAWKAAKAVPAACVLGVDLSPIQPSFGLPQNLRFRVDDLEEPWLEKQHFDFVFGRELAFCFENPRFVFNSAFHALKSGGRIELQDITLRFICDDGSLEGTVLERWMNQVMEAACNVGHNWEKVQEYKEMMEKVGFVDICENKYRWPVGSWPSCEKLKALGRLVELSLIDLRGIHAFSAKVMTQGMEMTSPDVETLVGQVSEEIRGGRVHAFIPVTVLCARKPT